MATCDGKLLIRDKKQMKCGISADSHSRLTKEQGGKILIRMSSTIKTMDFYVAENNLARKPWTAKRKLQSNLLTSDPGYLAQSRLLGFISSSVQKTGRECCRNIIAISHRDHRSRLTKAWFSDSNWTKTDAKPSAFERLATYVVPNFLDRNTTQNVPSVT